MPIPNGMTKWQASTIRNLIDLGVHPLTAISYPKKQALTVLDSLRSRNGGSEGVPA